MVIAEYLMKEGRIVGDRAAVDREIRGECAPDRSASCFKRLEPSLERSSEQARREIEGEVEYDLTRPERLAAASRRHRERSVVVRFHAIDERRGAEIAAELDEPVRDSFDERLHPADRPAHPHAVRVQTRRGGREGDGFGARLGGIL